MPGERPNRDRLIVGFAGRIGAGKTSAARHLERGHGFRYVRYSQVLSEWHAEAPSGRGELQAFGWEVMSGGKQPELNQRLIAKIDPHFEHAVDGLRHPIDAFSLKSHFGLACQLVYIDAPQEVRWQRHIGNPRYSNFQDFQRVDEHPVEQQIEGLIQLADAAVPNSGTLDELYSRIDAFVTSLRAGARQ
jgi:dephospho-CoA kinase